MAPLNLSHRRTHNLLLISKLLSLKDNASAFTLVLDSLEQHAKPLIIEYVKRAKASKTDIVFVSFESLHPPRSVDTFISARKKSPEQLAEDIATSFTPPSSPTTPHRKYLIIFDSLYPLISSNSNASLNLPAYLSSLLIPPKSNPQTQISLVATYHLDIPIPPSQSPYAPSTLTLLSYLATTVFTVHSLPQILAQKAASEKSLAAPVFGLAEEIEGVIIGLPGENGKKLLQRGNSDGLVIEMEHRRKSGRAVVEWYFLTAPDKHPRHTKDNVILLDDHPLYGRRDESDDLQTGKSGEIESTFELGLTDRQRRERQGVVLPYFDAQDAGGDVGEGGRILYNMGEEDDFDEEDDEI